MSFFFANLLVAKLNKFLKTMCKQRQVRVLKVNTTFLVNQLWG